MEQSLETVFFNNRGLEPPLPMMKTLEALEEVYDPELGVDIVNLGLVCDLHIVGDSVQVMMT